MKTLYKEDKAQPKALFCNSVLQWTLPLVEYYCTEIVH